MRETKIESHITSSITSRTMENSRTPTLVSPPDTKTPPTTTGKQHHSHGHVTNGAERAGSESVDASALSKALKDYEDAGRMRERTPGASPSRKRQRIYGDRSVNALCYFRSWLRALSWTLIEGVRSSMVYLRCRSNENGQADATFNRFIPNREGQDLQASFSLLHDDASPATPSKAKKRTPHGELHFQKSE